jgi:hypothetical protein
MSTYRPPIVNYKPPQLADLGLWGDIRFDASDAAPNYIGLHVTNGAATDLTDWKVLKFTYDTGAVTRVQTAYGTWDGRASLF